MIIYASKKDLEEAWRKFSNNEPWREWNEMNPRQMVFFQAFIAGYSAARQLPDSAEVQFK